MGSQTDLDQGGTRRQMKRIYAGPSVGWQEIPDTAILPVTSTGTTTVARGMNLVVISANGLVTIQLPSCLKSSAGAQAIPEQELTYPTTVVDVGGLANSTTHKYTILPENGKNIDGLASITIETPYGAYVLQPNVETGNWTLTQ